MIRASGIPPHHAEVFSVDSVVGKGSTFHVLVPLYWRGRRTAQISVPPPDETISADGDPA